MMAAASTGSPPRPTPPEAVVYVHPGRLAVSAGQSLTTVVGSGVAVCLWDAVRGIGGMAHFLLPEAGGAPRAQRYGDVAMNMLLDELTKAGAHAASLRARCYGGSAPPIDSASGHIGDRNVAAAQAFLVAHAIPIVDRDLGGGGARKLVFNSRDGATELTRIQHG